MWKLVSVVVYLISNYEVARCRAFNVTVRFCAFSNLYSRSGVVDGAKKRWRPGNWQCNNLFYLGTVRAIILEDSWVDAYEIVIQCVDMT